MLCIYADISLYYINAYLKHMLVAGEYHPRVTKYRDAMLLLQQQAHACDVRSYHNSMVDRWSMMRQAFSQLPSETETQKRLQHWKDIEAGWFLSVIRLLTAGVFMKVSGLVACRQFSQVHA